MIEEEIDREGGDRCRENQGTPATANRLLAFDQVHRVFKQNLAGNKTTE